MKSLDELVAALAPLVPVVAAAELPKPVSDLDCLVPWLLGAVAVAAALAFALVLPSAGVHATATAALTLALVHALAARLALGCGGGRRWRACLRGRRAGGLRRRRRTARCESTSHQTCTSHGEHRSSKSFHVSATFPNFHGIPPQWAAYATALERLPRLLDWVKAFRLAWAKTCATA